MASFSLGMLGILLLLDVFFVVNYFVIRALRRLVNEKQQTTQPTETTPSNKKNTPKYDTKYEEFAFAWVMGTVRLEAMSVKRFPGWKPLPYQIGILLTCLGLALSSILLSPAVMAQQLHMDNYPFLEFNMEFCRADTQQSALETLQQELENVTQLPLALEQHHLMTTVHQALLNDTALYGVDPYQCPSLSEDVSGYKQDWVAASNTNNDFFPGYCQQALEAAVEVAQERECIRHVCECPILPETTVFQVMGLSGKKFCAAQVCIPVPYPCPSHSLDTNNSTDSLQESLDYRKQQFQSAEERFQRQLATSQNNQTTIDVIPESFQTRASDTAEKILYQVDVASYIYIAYSCIALFFPSPLILFRMPYWISVKRFLFGVQKINFIVLAVAIWWGVEYFRTLWLSPDLQFYLAHLKLGLQDPCWIDPDYLLQRQDKLQQICQQLVPLEPEFYESAMTVSDILDEIQHFAQSCQCYFPNQHLSQAMANLMMSNTTMISTSYDDLKFVMVEMENSCIDESSCSIFLPNDNILQQANTNTSSSFFLGNASICSNATAQQEWVWNSHKATFDYETDGSDWYNLWVASGFLALLVVKIAMANFGLSLMTLADPFSICAGEFLWMPTTLGTTTTTSTATTTENASNDQPQQQQRGITRAQQSVISMVDEDGKATLPHELVQKWFRRKQRALFHVGLSKTIFWGFLVHLCMSNLFRTVYQEAYKGYWDFETGTIIINTNSSNNDTTTTADDDNFEIPPLYDLVEQRDMTVFGSCFGVALILALLGGFTVRRIQQEIGRLQSGENLPDTDDSSLEGEQENAASGGWRQESIVVRQIDADAEAFFAG